MAERLLKYYKYVSDEKGLLGQMELAKLTKLPATRASTMPDDDKSVALFRDAVKQITGKPAPTF